MKYHNYLIDNCAYSQLNRNFTSHPQNFKNCSISPSSSHYISDELRCIQWNQCEFIEARSEFSEIPNFSVVNSAMITGSLANTHLTQVYLYKMPSHLPIASSIFSTDLISLFEEAHRRQFWLAKMHSNSVLMSIYNKHSTNLVWKRMQVVFCYFFHFRQGAFQHNRHISLDWQTHYQIIILPLHKY